MFNSPLAKGKRTGYKRFRGKAFGKKKDTTTYGGVCLYCGYFTPHDALGLSDDPRIKSLQRLNTNCRNLWVCEKHLEPLFTLRWADLLCEITS